MIPWFGLFFSLTHVTPSLLSVPISLLPDSLYLSGAVIMELNFWTHLMLLMRIFLFHLLSILFDMHISLFVCFCLPSWKQRIIVFPTKFSDLPHNFDVHVSLPLPISSFWYVPHLFFPSLMETTDPHFFLFLLFCPHSISTPWYYDLCWANFQRDLPPPDVLF